MIFRPPKYYDVLKSETATPDAKEFETVQGLILSLLRYASEYVLILKRPNLSPSKSFYRVEAYAAGREKAAPQASAKGPAPVTTNSKGSKGSGGSVRSAFRSSFDLLLPIHNPNVPASLYLLSGRIPEDQYHYQ